MTKLTKEHFTVETAGGEAWVYYKTSPRAQTRQFVGRFKYMAKSSAKPFVTFLYRKFTKEQLEAFLAKGDGGEALRDEAAERGFILSHIKTWLKKDGFPSTKEGYEAWRSQRRYQTV